LWITPRQYEADATGRDHEVVDPEAPIIRYTEPPQHMLREDQNVLGNRTAYIVDQLAEAIEA
jgi:hypothetical protein